jgi:hypothetical protein
MTLGRNGDGVACSEATAGRLDVVVALLEHPAAVAQLAPDAVQAALEETSALVVQLGGLLARLTARRRATAAAAGAPAELLDVDAIRQRLGGVSRDWVYRRAKRWAFTRKLDGVLRFEAAGFERWLATRAAGGTPGLTFVPP